jgi:lipopolysaccharide biosynthesis regulator YciM
MNIKYIKLKTASKDVFKKIEVKKEDEDYSGFIESLKQVNPNDVNLMSEIKKTLQELTDNKEVRDEILKRLEE